MAENKKSVILYCDTIHTFEALEDAEAGRLIKHFLRYVNDLNPEAPDKLTQIAFEPIKQQLKRDLSKWENIIEKRIAAGKASAETRKQRVANSTHVESVEQNATNPTVNVNDTVNVNVNDTVIKKEIITEVEFLNFCKSFLNEQYPDYEFSLKAKYEAWVLNGWKDGNNQKIKNWKSKIKNTLPHLKKVRLDNPQAQTSSIPRIKSSDYATQQ